MTLRLEAFRRYNIPFPSVSMSATTGFYLEQLFNGRSSLPGNLSLLEQIRLLLGQEIIHLHIRISIPQIMDRFLSIKFIRT